MLLNKITWRQRKPLCQTNILKAVAIEDLEETQGGVACVLDVMS